MRRFLAADQADPCFEALESGVAFPNESLDDIVRRMANHNLTVLPVVENASGELIGSITNSDVVASIIGERKH